MVELNESQFGGDRGPREDEYPRYDDYLTDKKKWDRAQAAGKPYHDAGESALRHHREEGERQVKEEFDPEQKARQQKIDANMNKLKMVSKGLSAMGLKPARKRRWK